jgi:hypothetical protein
MVWIPPAIGLVVALVLFIYLLLKKNKSKEVTGVMLFALALTVYHLGDLGMWLWGSISQETYDWFRRIASVGYYFELPALLYLTYYCLPQEKRTMLVKVISWILVIPWVVALVWVYNSPNNFLEPPNIPDTFDPGKNETLMISLILCFMIGVIFASVNGFRAAKVRTGAAKGLSKTVAVASLIFLILEFILFSLIDAMKYDPTWLFGLISLIWILMVWPKTNAMLKETS